jgi:hypothetical protein
MDILPPQRVPTAGQALNFGLQKDQCAWKVDVQEAMGGLIRSIVVMGWCTEDDISMLD